MDIMATEPKDHVWDLNPIFHPKSMVVIGLSKRNFNHPGNTTFIKNQMEMQVKTYGVAPNMDHEQGFQIYKSVFDLPEVPDLAVICVGTQNAYSAIKDAAEFGVKGIVVITAGFAEVGAKGKELQDAIVKICYDHNMPLIGPNCVGVVTPPIVDTIFLPTERLVKPRTGNVAIVSQSGGVLMDQFFVSMFERNIGITTAVSVGNKAVIKESDLLKYFEQDPKTDVIAFYLEGFDLNDGRKFCELARKSKKDIVVYMGGRTESAKLAVGSHTASMAANGAVMEGAFRQYSIIQAYTEAELRNYLKVYSMIANPHRRFSEVKVQGDRVAFLTVSGGHGVLASDLLEKYHLILAQFSDKQKQEMELIMSPTAAKLASFTNPIDVTGSTTEDDMANLLDYLLIQPNVDIIVLLILPYPPQISMQMGRRIFRISSKINKPVITFVPNSPKYDLLRESMETNGIPCGHTVEEAVIMASSIRLKGLATQRRKMNNIQ